MAGGVMKCMEKRILYMAVLNEWVMESLCSLGSGNMYHLSYHPSLIAPELTMEIREGRLTTGNPIQIVLHKNGTTRRVSEAELHSVVDFRDYIRFEFRILSVIPFLKDGAVMNQDGYLCWLQESTV